MGRSRSTTPSDCRLTRAEGNGLAGAINGRNHVVGVEVSYVDDTLLVQSTHWFSHVAGDALLAPAILAIAGLSPLGRSTR